MSVFAIVHARGPCADGVQRLKRALWLEVELGMVVRHHVSAERPPYAKVAQGSQPLSHFSSPKVSYQV